MLGKVSLKKEDLHKYHGKDHWFPLVPVDANSEVQGKVHVQMRFDQHLQQGQHGSSPSQTKYRMEVRYPKSSSHTFF